MRCRRSAIPHEGAVLIPITNATRWHRRFSKPQHRGNHAGLSASFIKGEWVRVNSSDVGNNGAELDEESFLATFGRLMALPAIAFQARPDRWTASR